MVSQPMNKSSSLINRKLTKSDIAVFCILIMMGGLLVSRLFLSLGMIFFGINALWNVHPKKWLQQKWCLLGIAWVAVYALTWFWSDDKENWGAYVQNKLPILFLPLAFAYIPQWTVKQIQVLTLGIGIMLLAGACYSVSFLVFDYDNYIKLYNVSHMIPTPMYQEYISFSITNSLFAVWCAYIFPKLESRPIKYLVAFIAISLVLYNHVLASKSGLISFYVCLLGWGIYTIIAKRSIWGVVAVLGIPVILTAAVTYVPTLRERKEHIVYTYYRFRSNDKTGSLGDISRLISYDIAFKLMKEHPVIGTGVGDIGREMDKGYDKWYPEVVDSHNRLIPHNQFLTVGLGCGIPAMLLFAAWVFVPLQRLGKNRESFFFFIVWLSLLVQLMIEPFLEGQIGLFVYILFILLFLHIIPYNNKKTTAPVY